MISVSVHVTFKSGKIMHLNCYFSYWPHPYKKKKKKKSSQKCTRWANFNPVDTKACVNDNCIDLFVFLFSVI